nr:zinc finger, CCHC-type [Tanacetum cinerariifolium]
IAFAVGKLSRYTSNPSAQHWQALARVFQYLKGTMNYGLTYSGYPSIIEGYFDASWINNTEDHSSTSGWVFLLGGGFSSLAKEDTLSSYHFEGCNIGSAKELWESLESKYMAEDASPKKFLVSNFMNYKMVDTRPVMEQFHEMLRILGQSVMEQYHELL